MFVQASAPNDHGPILIEAVCGADLGNRLAELARDNAYEAMLIGLLESTTPELHAQQIAAQVEAHHLHHQWYASTGTLIAFIQTSAQRALQELLALTHPGALPTEPVDIDEMARLLNVSVPTVRRMVKRGEIPFLRSSGERGHLRFIPQEVFASLQRR